MISTSFGMEDNAVSEKDTKSQSKDGLKDSDLISMYRLMVLVREFEMKVCQIYSQKGLPELPHLCVGQEAVGVGSCYGLRKDDYVLPSLRGRSVFLTKGISPSILMAGIYGKATGPSKGKWTAHHMGDLENGIIAGSLLIGSQFPIAVGAGLAFKVKNTDQVCLCYFGDGASNRGDFHEGLNLAAVLKLPVIFICENNLYAIDTPVEKALLIKDIALRAQAYGMPGKTIDGNDVLEVHHTVQEAVKRGRKGGGPTLIECKTYRLRPHCERYQELRPKEELDYWWRQCPIKRFRASLMDKKLLNEEQDREMGEQIKEEVNQAVRFAEESPYPQPEEIFEDVYAHGSVGGGRLCMK
jgi:TPP-dependent pyruvate/acetoin dehydrogenase alpha subunit